MKSSLKALVLLSALAASLPSMAGEFAARCYYTSSKLADCTSQIKDIVTDKFTNKYPATKWEITVLTDAHRFSDGGYSAFGVAGVVTRGSKQVPMRRFSTHLIDGSNTPYDEIALAQQELNAKRRAVKVMMDQCELSPTCDLDTE